MANVIKIKRSSSTATPTSLSEGELAYSYLSGKLFIGNSSAVIPIGGEHTPGVLTANQALVVNATSEIDKLIVANLVPTVLQANGTFGTDGQVLSSNSSGGLYWTTLTATAAGTNTEIQFNNSGLLGSNARFTWDNATGVLTVGNSTVNVSVNSTVVTTTNLTVTGIVSANGATGTDGQVLSSNSTGGVYWAAPVTDLDGLSDVTISSAANNNVLVYDNDAGQWENHTVSGNSGQANVVFSSQNITVALTPDVTIDTTLTIGNSTVNTAVNSTAVAVGSSITVGSNLSLNTSALFIGNSTVNAVLTSSSLDIDGTITAGNGSFVDMTVSGNLTVTGTLTTIDTVNMTVKDPLIKLANGNVSADSVDIGLYGVYNDGTVGYTAFFRDQSDSGKYKLYTGLSNEPSTTVDLTGGSLAALVVGALEATSITLSSPLGVPSGGTGAGTFTSKGVIYGNGTSALQVTAAGTDGQILQANSTGFPVFADLDGGTF